MTVAELQQKYQKVRTESEFIRRKKSSAAFNARKALSEITKEDLELLSPIAPEIRIIVAFTQEEIADNKNGEVAMIERVKEQLRTFAEQRLTFYEEHL